jgi:release factor glutamine methyltransferase
VSEIWTVLKVLQWTQGRFAERGIETPRLDAEVLLAHVLGKDRVGLYTHFDQPLKPEELTAYRELIKRRLASEPVAYLVKQKEFRSLTLKVDERVLIPRPDTETLVDAALSLLPAGAARIVDVGTGSGAIALALKAARPLDDVHAVDRSEDALAVARENGTRLSLDVGWHRGDLLDPVRALAPFDLIVSNPPYIPTAEIASLQAEVRREPRAALDGGSDGLDVMRRLVAEGKALLGAGGALALEVGDDQADKVAELLRAAGLTEIVKKSDLAGTARVVCGRRTG